jgi:hypothetical protein
VYYNQNKNIYTVNIPTTIGLSKYLHREYSDNNRLSKYLHREYSDNNRVVKIFLYLELTQQKTVHKEKTFTHRHD